MNENQDMQEQSVENQENNSSIEENTQQQEVNSQEVENNETSKCEEELSQEKDKYVRLFAEFDNFKKRSQKEKQDFFRYANQDTLVAMLPIVDDFERAINQLGENEANQEALEGVKLIYNKFYNTLKDKGLEKIEIKPGDAFDVETQEAITQVETDDAAMKNKVVDVIETGYKLGDKVIRYAKVVTGK